MQLNGNVKRRPPSPKKKEKDCTRSPARSSSLSLSLSLARSLSLSLSVCVYVCVCVCVCVCAKHARAHLIWLLVSLRRASAKRSIVGAIMLFFALSFHSFIVGLALGTYRKTPCCMAMWLEPYIAIAVGQSGSGSGSGSGSVDRAVVR